MVDITNASRAMRGINTTDQGTVWLQPGQTAEGLNVSPEEMKVLERVAKDYGLIFGNAQEAREQLKAQAEEEGDMAPIPGEDNAIGGGLLGAAGGGSTNYEDASTTDIPQVAATLHPLPADMDVGEPEPPLDTMVVAQPWAAPAATPDTGEEAGEGATTGGDDGGAKTRRAKARE